MMIEYHYGCKNLKEKIEKSGFKVSVTIPKIDQEYRKNVRFYGDIFAERY
jgi:hypothetical protein